MPSESSGLHVPLLVTLYVVVPAVPEVGEIVGAIRLTGAATDVVNEAPVVVAVSPVGDVIVRVGVYVAPDDKPVIDLLVAVAPP